MRDLAYEETHIGYDEQYPEGGIKCKNYEICGGVLPKWWFDCKGHYLCVNCDVMFGSWCGGKGDKPTHCASHRLPDMIDLKHLERAKNKH